MNQQPRPAIEVGQTWRSKADGVANIKIRAQTVNTEQWVVRENEALYPAQVYENYFLADEGDGEWAIGRITAEDNQVNPEYLEPSGGWGTVATMALFRSEANATDALPWVPEGEVVRAPHPHPR